MKRQVAWVSILIFLSLVIVSVSFAADYPSKPITLINPQAPGGTLDIQARAFASGAEKILGQPVVVVNKTGATGMVGGLAGAQANSRRIYLDGGVRQYTQCHRMGNCQWPEAPFYPA